MKNPKLITLMAAILLAIAILLGLINREPDGQPTNLIGLARTPPGLQIVNKPDSLNPTDPETATTFLAGGDISLSRNIAWSIDKTNNPLLPFEKLAPTLEEVDFSFANLESPFSKTDAYTPKNTLIFNAPKKNVQGLVKYKFKILNLANNHALDQGKTGVTTTLEWLRQHDIVTVGVGENLNDAWQGKIMVSGGIKIGFVCASYASNNDGGKNTNQYVARIEDMERLKQEIQNLKTRSDFVVACMHAGTEYTRNPNKTQITFAHAAIDSGADLVIGHHPHWIQTIEKYNDKYIFYSLGNLIFDQSWSQETKEGLLVKVVLQKTEQTKIKALELLPVIIENNSTPRLASPTEKIGIIKKIGLAESILPK